MIAVFQQMRLARQGIAGGDALQIQEAHDDLIPSFLDRMNAIRAAWRRWHFVFNQQSIFHIGINTPRIVN